MAIMVPDTIRENASKAERRLFNRFRSELPDNCYVLHSLGLVSHATKIWGECETYDFFGVQFTGHPDLRRILNVEDMIMFPMRKEYPLEDQTREDKKDIMFGR